MGGRGSDLVRNHLLCLQIIGLNWLWSELSFGVRDVRILFLSGWFPYPPDNGARIRTFNLLRQLAQRHDISLLSFTQEERIGEGDWNEVESLCEVLGTVRRRDFQPSRPRALLCFLSPIPRAVLEIYSPEMEAQVQDALRRHAFDVIVASEIGPGLGTVPYVLGCKGVPG